MIEIAALVTDTHPLIFHAARRASLGKKARAYFDACERQEAIIYVPAVVVWETFLLARRGHINLRRSAREFFDDLFSNPAYQPFDLTNEQIYTGSEIRFNNDPFDALVCASALALDLPLITRDGDIVDSGLIKIVW